MVPRAGSTVLGWLPLITSDFQGFVQTGHKRGLTTCSITSRHLSLKFHDPSPSLSCYQGTGANMATVGAATSSVVAEPTMHPTGIAHIPHAALDFDSACRVPLPTDV